MPLASLLGLPGYRVIMHDAPLDSRTIRTVKTRYVTTEAKCYADLLIDDVVYSREYARGQNLKSFIRFRAFGTADVAQRAFGTWLQTKLKLFSLDPPVEDDAAVKELTSAFGNNMTAFAQLLGKKP